MDGPSFSGTGAVSGLLRAVVFDIFDEREHERRRAAIPTVFTDDVEFVSPNGTITGHDDLDEAVRTLHARLPEFRFHQTSEVQVVGDAARVSWGLGPDGEPARVTGIDVIKVRDGRVALLMTFLDNSVVASPDLHTNK